MHESYDPAVVERAAQQYWDERCAFEVREDPARTKFYCLSMLPYPSGKLHMWALSESPVRRGGRLPHRSWISMSFITQSSLAGVSPWPTPNSTPRRLPP